MKKKQNKEYGLNDSGAVRDIVLWKQNKIGFEKYDEGSNTEHWWLPPSKIGFTHVVY